MHRLIPFLLSLALVACGDKAPPSIGQGHELIVLTRDGLTTYTVDETNGPSGFEHDLIRLFAEDLGMKPRFVVAPRESDIVARLKHGEAHFAAAWLTPSTDPELKNSPGYFSSGNVVVQHEAALPITELAQLDGRTLHVLAGSRQAAALRDLQAAQPNLKIEEVPAANEVELLEMVATQRVGAALVDSSALEIAANFFPVLQSALEIGPEQTIVWQLPANASPTLAAKVSGFMERINRDGTLARLKDRYFGHVDRLTQADAVHFIESIETVLPRFRQHFQAAQEETDIDWRLLAALAYQESQWDPLATSPTGVRGMMMLTEDTADQLGVGNRLEAAQSIRAGSRYFSGLRDALPATVGEPDRTWLAVAAYNLGMGHMNGARAIAQGLKKDPDSWYEMKAVLPLLSRAQYYQRLKSGKARGGEAVITAENVRSYYDVLSRHEPPYRPMSMGGSLTRR